MINNTEIIGSKCINCRLSGTIYNNKVSLSIFGKNISDQDKLSTAFSIATLVSLENKGFYSIQYGIEIAKETTIYGNNAILISDDFGFRTFSPLYVYNLSIKAVKESIILDHEGDNNVEKAIIESCNLSTTTINNNKIYGFKSYCDDLVVSNCSLSGGIWVAHISNSHLKEGTYVRFENNMVSNGFGLVRISNLNGGIISGNVCRDTKQFGICTLQSKNIRISNNEVTNFSISNYSAGNGIVLSENSFDCVVSNNKCIVTNDCGGGIVSDTQLSIGKSGGRNFINGNEVVFLNNAAGNGIIINGSDSCIVDNNHIVKSTISGIHSAYSDDVTISGNFLDQCSNTLIQCNYANNNVINNNICVNLIENKCDKGIYVGNCLDVVVSHNNIVLHSNQNCYNIYYRCSSGAIRNNSFSQEGAHGYVCVFANYSSNVIVLNNTFTSKGVGLNYLYRIGHASKLVAIGNVYDQRESNKDCKAFLSNDADCALYLSDYLNGIEIKASLTPR